MSVFACALALANLNGPGIARSFRMRTPVRMISAILMLLAVGLGGIWVFYSVRFALTGALPEETLLVQPAANLHLAYVLDLALLAPSYALAAVLLWRRAAWGYALAGVLLPFSVVYQLNYMIALGFQAAANVPGATAFDPQEPFVLAIVLLATVLLFAGLGSPQRDADRRFVRLVRSKVATSGSAGPVP